MKRICLISVLAVMLLAPVVAGAQIGKSIKLGLKIAPALSWINPSTEDYYSDGARMGISAGLITDFYFAEYYALSTGFNFMFPSGKLTFVGEDEINNIVYSPVEIHRIYNFIYLEIPLMVKMKTKEFGAFSFYGQVGFGTGFRLKTTAKDEFDDLLGGHHTKEWVYTTHTTLMREAILVGGGAEFRIDPTVHLFAGVNYSNTLHDVLTGVNDYNPLVDPVNEKGMLNFLELSVGVLF